MGHFWQNPGEGTEGTGYWGIESSKTDGATNITLNTDVTRTENDKTNTITIGAGQDVNLDLNNNNITGTAGSDVIDVKGDLSITGGEEDGKNTISGGKTGIDVEQGGTLALDSVTVTNNEIGVSFFDNLSVTFIGDQNVVSGNTSKQISGNGKVTFNLDGKNYQVDASTADALLKNSGKVVAADYNWIAAESKDGSYAVAYTGNRTDIRGYDVNQVIEGAQNAIGCEAAQITSFVIPNSITTIGAQAFNGIDRPYLTNIHIPDSVTRVENYAFRGSLAIKDKFTIPTNWEYIGQYAFMDCNKLTEISFASDSKLEKIDKGAFSNCINLGGTVSIPSGVTTIGGSAFERSKEATSAITKVELPNTLKTIGGMAFANCIGLTELTIPDGVETIGNGAFGGCTGLTGKLVIPNSVKTIETQAFNTTGFTEVVLPEGLTTIANALFNSCPNLTKVDIPSSVTRIGVEAFRNCAKLAGPLTLPAGVTIDNRAFKGCSSLVSVVFPTDVKFTGSAGSAFSETSITNAICYATETDAVDAVKSILKGLDDVRNWNDPSNPIFNVYTVSGNENLVFYREAVKAAFHHDNGDAEVSTIDGSVNLTSVSGTITAGDETVTLPNVAGITASINTNGKITLYVPSAITVGGEEYPDGAIVTVDPNGNISARERPSDDLPVISFDFDAITADTSTTIEDEEVPLAGLVTLAELLEALRQYEGIEDVELPEDFQWVDHEYAQAIYWGLQEALVVDTEDDPLDPDEIVTVALLREVLENFVDYKGADLTVTVEDEDDMIVMDLGERLTVFYGELEAALEGKAA